MVQGKAMDVVSPCCAALCHSCQPGSVSEARCRRLICDDDTNRCRMVKMRGSSSDDADGGAAAGTHTDCAEGSLTDSVFTGIVKLSGGGGGGIGSASTAGRACHLVVVPSALATRPRPSPLDLLHITSATVGADAVTSVVMPVSDGGGNGSRLGQPGRLSPLSEPAAASQQAALRPSADHLSLSSLPASMQTRLSPQTAGLPLQPASPPPFPLPASLSPHVPFTPWALRTLSSSSVESMDSGFSSAPCQSPDPAALSSQPPVDHDNSPFAPRSSDSFLCLYRRLPRVSCDTDYDRLGRSMRALQDGCFYYPDLDSDGARTLLDEAPEGAFLVRDSSDPRFLFAITVKTEKGATSVRIQYHNSLFQLDCEDHMRCKLPRFETVLELLDFHRSLCQERQGSQYRWLESSRRKDMVVRLTTPRRHSPPSLSHLARLSVNRCLPDLHLPSLSTDLLPLPSSIKQFLRAHPHKM